MNKLMTILNVIEVLTLIIGVPLFVISFIVNGICLIAGLQGTFAYEITNTIGLYLAEIVCPLWMILWIFNSVFSLFLINTK